MAEMKKHVNLNEMPQERQLSREFHSTIAEASGNDLLIKLYAVVTNAFPDWLLYEAVFRKPELLAGSIAQYAQGHIAIVDALTKGMPIKPCRNPSSMSWIQGKWLEEYLNIPAELLREKEELVLPLMQKSK